MMVVVNAVLVDLRVRDKSLEIRYREEILFSGHLCPGGLFTKWKLLTFMYVIFSYTALIVEKVAKDMCLKFIVFLDVRRVASANPEICSSAKEALLNLATCNRRLMYSSLLIIS